MSYLASEMKNLTDYVLVALKQNKDATDPHWKTCVETAHVFNLWQAEEGNDGTFFPTWLSYVVQGIGRDNGLLD